MTLNPPADFSLHNARRGLIEKRNFTTDPVKREQLTLLIEQITEFDRASDRRMELAQAIERQLKIVAPLL
jgi:hypothetical protein